MLIDVELLKENEDGSAVYSFNLSEDMKDAFVRFGIMQAIKAGIEAAKELHPEFDNDWTPEDMSYRPGGLAQAKEQQSCDKREWVGLTDKEVDNIVAYPWGETKEWVRAVEAALKEKNL